MLKKPIKKIVICDIDGTIADNEHRQELLNSYKDWDKFFLAMKDDKPIMKVIDLIKQKQIEGKYISFITGRPERYREMTLDWLKEYFKFKFSLYMRKDNDSRSKLISKKELFENNFKTASVDCCIDNDQELLKMWKEMGLNCVDANKLL